MRLIGYIHSQKVDLLPSHGFIAPVAKDLHSSVGRILLRQGTLPLQVSLEQLSYDVPLGCKCRVGTMTEIGVRLMIKVTVVMTPGVLGALYDT